jgi:hypothetical protein
MDDARPTNPATAFEPAWRALPAREFSLAFIELRARIFEWLADYYDGDHLTRAGDWLLVLDPGAPEWLVLAALMHDLERSVPGGPVLDKAAMAWDDAAYNRAHCERSAVVASDWLARQGAPPELVENVRRPIREHEFGGSPEGDLVQAADSISFLEVDGGLVTSWARDGECSPGKARAKLDWMLDRIRLEPARALALPYHRRSVEQLERALAG